MKKAAIYSAILHVAIFVVMVVGLYNPFARTLTNQQSIMFDFVQVADQSAAPKLTPTQSVKPAAKQKPKPEEKPTPPTPEPEPAPPELEEKPEPETKPTPPTPEPETKPEPTPIPPPEKPKKQEDKKPTVVKPKSKPKAELSVEKKKAMSAKKTDKKTKKKEQNFEDILNNITNEYTETASTEEGAPASKISDTLTGSEIDSINQQIKKCWSFPAGAKGDQDLVVDIELEIERDGTVTKAEIVDQARMSRDPFFRTAAESAKRAVLNPQCSPLKLPPDKYNQWKHMIFGFNPKELFQ